MHKLRGMFASAPPPAQAPADSNGLVVELAAAPELTPTDASAESPVEKLEASIEDASDLPGITAMDGGEASDLTQDIVDEIVQRLDEPAGSA